MRTARRATGVVDSGTFATAPLRGKLRWLAIDASALLLLLLLVAFSFYPVFGTGWLFVTALGFGAVGMGIGVLSTLRGLNVLATSGAAVLAWFVFGGFFTMPSSTIGGLVPTGRTLFGLLTGPVTAWRDMLTLTPPIGETFNLLTVPGLVALVSGLAGVLVALRSRAPMLAWVPPAFGYLIGVLVGSQTVFRPVLVGGIFFLVVLLWTTYRRGVARGALAGGTGRIRPLRVLLGVATVAVAGLLTVVLAPLIAGGADRVNVRAEIQPPIDMSQFASPLQGYRANIAERKDVTVLRVTGALEGEIVRVATLDKYDGLSYSVSSLDDSAVEATTFTRVGQWIADEGEGTPRSLTVQLDEYDSVWTPTMGRTTGVSFEGERRIPLTESFYYNRSSGTGLVTAGLKSGDSYTLQARVPGRPDDSRIAAAAAGEYPLPDSENVPEIVLSRARTIVGEGVTAGAAALELEAALREGYFSHGQSDEAESLPGHSERRLITLFESPNMVGDHEQYATAMALMARELGIPARVIYGYRAGNTATVNGSQVGAWPELYLRDLGWVTFDPTPPEDRKLPEEPPHKPPEQQPFVENPPPPPLRPEVPQPDDQVPIDPGKSPEDENRIDWARVGAVALLTGIPLLTVVAPVVLVLGLKLRRRARRRGDAVIANRVAGAWSELVDRARDVGRSPSVSATRTEQAEAFKEDFPDLREHSDPVGLAKEADWLVFAPGEPSEERASEYWSSTSVVRRGMRRSVGGVRWLLSHLSVKSFRRIR
ncbi:Transglutaminase-like superfamily protein [Tessaracoccus bendigoensis DSM 12906]|uniref:Transglutaminase-like superfamily protein n=1 Tax=Tessaracoccus bendigoensis DSM 12906 TaxID=1123357 RepID=A0A1M6J3L3_9ACTN|nr:transglutaminase domain-containing protein [Tessaracoccus bendigoensis]SHJ41141.1 Transglutaminase-like superfamily protein [Tessaracoccus bendigoensis DSM 12906]